MSRSALHDDLLAASFCGPRDGSVTLRDLSTLRGVRGIGGIRLLSPAVSALDDVFLQVGDLDTLQAFLLDRDRMRWEPEAVLPLPQAPVDVGLTVSQGIVAAASSMAGIHTYRTFPNSAKSLWLPTLWN